MSDELTTTLDRIPLKRALVSVYDKSGLEDLVRGLARGRRRAGLHGRLRCPHRQARHPGDQGGGPHRLSRVPRRPGQDAAPEGARRHPRRPPARLPRRPAGRARRRAVRPGGLQPVSVHPDRGLGREPGRVRRADRHRRTVDGAGRGEEPPLGRDRHLTRSVRRRARRSVRRWLHARAAQGTGGRGVPAHGELRRRGRVLDEQRPHRQLRRLRLSLVDGRDLGEGRGAALRREPTPAGGTVPALAGRPGGCGAAARQGDVLQQLRRHRRSPEGRQRFRGAGRGDHQARQPVRHRGRCRRRRGTPARRMPATRSPPSAG